MQVLVIAKREREREGEKKELRESGEGGRYIRANGRKLVLISGVVHCALFVKWKWSRR